MIRRTVLVTGGGRGLGRAISTAFGARGDRVAIFYRTDEAAALAAGQEIEETGGEAAVFRADVRDPKAVEAGMVDVVSRFGPLDVCVANAGITRDALLVQTTEETWDEVVGTNLTGVFNVLRDAGRMMAETGSVFVIGSIVGLFGRRGQCAYSASKAALVALVQTAAREWAVRGIRVNLVLPGYLPGTGVPADLMPAARAEVEASHLLPVFSSPEAVASFIVDLSRSCPGVTGQIFNLDSRIRGVW
ncbi:MAG: SDR family oxidoreductase [Nitrospirae bacterium]|nr:SDR family oxidoreductase [Nitrospirota bacterium]